MHDISTRSSGESNARLEEVQQVIRNKDTSSQSHNKGKRKRNRCGGTHVDEKSYKSCFAFKLKCRDLGKKK